MQNFLQDGIPLRDQGSVFTGKLAVSAIGNQSPKDISLPPLNRWCKNQGQPKSHRKNRVQKVHVINELQSCAMQMKISFDKVSDKKILTTKIFGSAVLNSVVTTFNHKMSIEGRSCKNQGQPKSHRKNRVQKVHVINELQSCATQMKN